MGKLVERDKWSYASMVGQCQSIFFRIQTLKVCMNEGGISMWGGWILERIRRFLFFLTVVIFIHFPGYRFRQLVLRAPTRLHLHSVPVLSGSRSHSWSAIRHAYWHVEFGLHLSWIIDWIPTFAWRRWGRPIVMYHRASGNATSETPWPK